VKELLPQTLLEMCGASGPVEIHVEQAGSTEVRRRVLSRPFALVGRQASADVLLDDEAVSARHAYLQVIDGRLFGVDLASRSGTRWGEAAGTSAWVGPDVPVRIGPFSLRVRGGLAAPATSEDGNCPLSTLCHLHGTWPALQLEIFYHDKKPVTWVVNRTLTLLGRSDVCRIRLHDASVSRVHFSLLRTKGGLIAVDLGGRGGIAINGRQLSCGLFEEGDELQAGAFRIRLGRRTSGAPLRLATHSAASVLPTAPFPEALPEDSLTGLLMLRLVDQFARLQQQMHDSFQQTLMMAVGKPRPAGADAGGPRAAPGTVPAAPGGAGAAGADRRTRRGAAAEGPSAPGRTASRRDSRAPVRPPQGHRGRGQGAVAQIDGFPPAAAGAVRQTLIPQPPHLSSAPTSFPPRPPTTATHRYALPANRLRQQLGLRPPPGS
jgi:pSer/pThr/pTyr-binding forkhead associated (FHA) protein